MKPNIYGFMRSELLHEGFLTSLCISENLNDFKIKVNCGLVRTYMIMIFYMSFVYLDHDTTL